MCGARRGYADALSIFMIEQKLPLIAATAVMLLGASFTLSINSLMGGSLSHAPIQAKLGKPDPAPAKPETKPQAQTAQSAHRQRAHARPARRKAAPTGAAVPVSRPPVTQTSPPEPAATPVRSAPAAKQPARSSAPVSTPTPSTAHRRSGSAGNFYDTG
jgi:hypothetical protein